MHFRLARSFCLQTSLLPLSTLGLLSSIAVESVKAQIVTANYLDTLSAPSSDIQLDHLLSQRSPGSADTNFTKNVRESLIHLPSQTKLENKKTDLTQVAQVNPSIPGVEIPPPQDVTPPTPNPAPTEQPTPPPQLPSPEDLLEQQPTTPATPEDLTDGVPGTITVERFEFVGNTAFSHNRLAEQVAQFTGHPITFAELLQARSVITDFYIQQGYITSGAYIPADQSISPQAAVIKIQIVEGGLEGIQVTGTRRLNPDYVRDRLAVGIGKPLNRERLLETLQLLQLNPLIQNISAELSAGSRPGQSLLEVRVTEAKTFRTEFGVDNARSPSVGSFRRTGQINQANLLGLGDELSVAYSNTDGSDSLDASYTLPINARNGTLSFAYGTTSSDVIEEPFNFLDINANSRYAELTLRQPVVQSPRQEFALGLTLSRRQTQAKFGLEEFEGEAFPSPGADEEGRTRLSALRFFQEWTQRSSREVLAFRSQFSVGLGILGATINNESPDSRFFSWRGQGQWVRLLAPDTLLLLRTDLQIADRAILPIEQFGLGGQQSVRGYRQDLLLADNGAFASAEVRLPIIRRARQEPILLLIPFVDVGAVWNNSDTPPPRSTLASVGLGLQWQIGRLTARLDWGIPLVDIDSRGRTWQENGIHFSVRYNPF